MSTITKSLIAKLEKEPHNEGLKLDIKLLEKLLKKAILDYYNTDKPLLTDKTFDILETILKERYPESELFKTIGAPIANLEDKVKMSDTIIQKTNEKFDIVDKINKNLVTDNKKLRRKNVIIEIVSGILIGALTYQVVTQ